MGRVEVELPKIIYLKKVIKIKLLFLCQNECQVKYPEECYAYYCAESFSPGGDLRYLPPLMGSVYCQDLASVQLQGDSGPHGNNGRSHAVSRCLLTL